MQKIIEQLYKGELYPSEQLDIKSEEYKEARKAAYQAYEEFEGKLCQTMKGELDELWGKHMESSYYEDTRTFVNGFKLGARMMAEIFWEDKG